MNYTNINGVFEQPVVSHGNTRVRPNLAVHFSSKSDEWETPRDLFEQLNGQFHFTLAPCCRDQTAKWRDEHDGKLIERILAKWNVATEGG